MVELSYRIGLAAGQVLRAMACSRLFGLEVIVKLVEEISIDSVSSIEGLTEYCLRGVGEAQPLSDTLNSRFGVLGHPSSDGHDKQLLVVADPDTRNHLAIADDKAAWQVDLRSIGGVLNVGLSGGAEFCGKLFTETRSEALDF